jgi:hypothetical protein
MPLQIFVEDRLTDAYEILALRALGLPTARRDRRRVRAVRIDLDELTSRASLFDLAQRSWQSGYDCVLFIMDEEGLPRSPDRPAKLRDFRQAFRELCDHLATLKTNDPLRNLKVTRIVCRRCLEGWLAADPQAIVDSVRGSRGLDYRPDAQKTDDLLPHQALDRIAQIIREAGKRLGRHDLARLSSGSIKSRGASIAEHVQPERARRHNASLKYFLDMVDGSRSGCEHPFPENR